MNCPVAKAAFVPGSSAEEIDIINGQNLDCDVEIWARPGDCVTACPPAGEGAKSLGMSPGGGRENKQALRGLPRLESEISGTA